MSRRTELPSAEQPTAAGYNALTSSAAARADSLITAMKDTCPNPASQDGYLALCRALFLRDALKTQLTQTQPDDVASAARAYACAAHTVKVIADHATTLVSSLSFEDSLASAAIPPRVALADSILPVAADAALDCTGDDGPASYQSARDAECPPVEPPQNVHAYFHDDRIRVSWDPGPVGVVGYTVTTHENGEVKDIAGGCHPGHEADVNFESAYPIHPARIRRIQVTAYTEASHATSPEILVQHPY